jgi:hypothetical protein
MTSGELNRAEAKRTPKCKRNEGQEMAIEILVPSIIKVGGGAIAEASSILKRLGVKDPLIVTDTVLVRMGLAESLREQIEKAASLVAFFRKPFRIRRLTQ